MGIILLKDKYNKAFVLCVLRVILVFPCCLKFILKLLVNIPNFIIFSLFAGPKHKLPHSLQPSYSSVLGIFRPAITDGCCWQGRKGSYMCVRVSLCVCLIITCPQRWAWQSNSITEATTTGSLHQTSVRHDWTACGKWCKGPPRRTDINTHTASL